MHPYTGMLAASGGSFSPVVEFGADLRGWWDASDLTTITKDGANGVSNWNSKAVGITGVAENDQGMLVLPLWEAAGRNGRPSIKFVQQGYFTLSAPVSPISSSPATMVAVGYVDLGDGGYFLAQGEGPNNYRQVRSAGGGTPQYQIGSVVGINGSPTWQGNDRIFVGQNGGSSDLVQLNIDGGASVTAMPTGAINVNSARARIGASSQIGSGQLTGKIQELIAIDRQITTLERQKLEGYLAAKWNLISLLPDSHPFKGSPP